MPSNDIILFI